MQFLLTVTILLLVLGGLSWAARRNLRLFVIHFERGRMTKLVGRMPPQLLADLKDVVSRHQPRRLQVECQLRRGHPELTFNRDAEPGLVQIVRNLVGGYPAIRLKHARHWRRG